MTCNERRKIFNYYVTVLRNHSYRNYSSELNRQFSSSSEVMTTFKVKVYWYLRCTLNSIIIIIIIISSSSSSSSVVVVVVVVVVVFVVVGIIG